MIAEEKSRGREAFIERVEQGLAKLEEVHKFATSNKIKPPELSISKLSRDFKFSRSTLYSRHPDLVVRILATFEALNSEPVSGIDKSAKPSVKSLQRENLSLKRRYKKDLAEAHSAKLDEFIKDFGPAFREGARLIAEISALKARVRELELKNAKLQEINKRYLQAQQRGSVKTSDHSVA